MNKFQIHLAVSLLHASYGQAIDDDRLEEWPEFFTDDCFYSITSHDNHARGFEAGIVYCDSKGMLKDRVSGLREANIYERHRYRHIVSMPATVEAQGAVVKAVPGIERHGLVGPQKERRFIHVIPETGDACRHEIAVQRAPPGTRVAAGEVRKDRGAGPNLPDVQRAIGSLEEMVAGNAAVIGHKRRL